METVFYNNKIYRVQQKKIVQMIFMNYISIIYIIKQPNGSIRWLYSASELILPGHRLATWIPKFQCFIRYVPLFHRFFILCQSALSCVFLGFFRECSHANVLLCVCFHARTTNIKILILCLCWFSKKLAKQRFKKPKPMFIGWICDSLNQSGHGVGTKRQQSFLFGSEGRNALVSSDQSMLSKCDDVITYATEPLNIQTRQMQYLEVQKLLNI